MFKKSQVGIIALLAAALIFVLSFSGAFAAAPLTLHMEVLDVIGGSGEAFTASGPAVDDGLVCASGTVDDISIVPHGGSGSFTILDVQKRFYCGDGTFDIFMIVRLNNTTLETVASWQLGAGTGNYAGLRGGGQLVGTPVNPGVTILDVYDGKVL